MNTEIYHHGIKGQQWGVRNGPPYPIEDKVLKAGHKINSVSSKYYNSDVYKNNGRWMYGFNPDDEHDAAIYRGPFSKYLVLYKGARFIREHEYETVKDLKMPTKKQRIDEFVDLVNDEKYGAATKADIDRFKKALIVQQIGDEKDRERWGALDPYNIKTKEDVDTAYSIFSHAMEAAHQNVSTNEYMKRMSSKYDAMVDDNNQGVYNNAHDPVIIFRANEALKDISNPKSPRYLTVDDIMNNYQKIKDRMAKEGKNVRL